MSSTEELEERVRKLEHILRLHFEIDRISAKSHYERDVLKKIVESARELLDVEQCAIMLIETEKGRQILRTKEIAGLPDKWYAFEIEVGESISGNVAATGEPIIIPDMLEDPRPKYTKNDTNLRAMASVPISNRDNILGVLNVFKSTVYKFKDEEVNELSMLANKAAISIENARAHKREQTAYISSIRNIITLMENKNKYTVRHSEKVVYFVENILDVMGVDEKEREIIKYAAELHDIGKIRVSGTILEGDKPLSAEEQKMIEAHARTGASLVESMNLPFSKEIACIIMRHHENLDGSGYYRKNAEDIPVGARILRVADSFEAMTTVNRPFERTKTPEQALKELFEQSDTKYDRRVVEAFSKTNYMKSFESDKQDPPSSQPKA